MHPCDDTETLLRMLEPFRRNNYFYGKRMDVQHCRMEQDYGKLKQWLVNRLTFGKGVVCGLDISVQGRKLCVDPGFAIDGLGREIVVPVRACIDPVTGEGGCCEPCCDQAGVTPPPQQQPPPPGQTGNPTGALTHVNAATPGAGASGPAVDALAAADGRSASAGTVVTTAPGATVTRAGNLFTLWLCYRECRADYQPVLVSDCGTRDQCAPGTIVETFCLKVTPGAPPRLRDPAWCAKLWEPIRQPAPQPSAGSLATGTHASLSPSVDANDLASIVGARGALLSRRQLLCELFDQPCDPAEGDPCVPLAVLLLDGDNPIRFETCPVRPRVYSNAMLLDLILCLAAKVDECCGKKQPQATPQPMRVKSVQFLAGPNRTVVATVQSPLAAVKVPIGKLANAIRVTFTQPFDQAANAPTTPAAGDAQWKGYNVLVTRDSAAPPNDYIPGSIQFEAADTLRWDLDAAVAQSNKGWPKGNLRLSLFGDPDAASGRKPIDGGDGLALDGEPIAPAGGAISGDGQPGGTFILRFTVA